MLSECEVRKYGIATATRMPIIANTITVSAKAERLVSFSLETISPPGINSVNSISNLREIAIGIF